MRPEWALPPCPICDLDACDHEREAEGTGEPGDAIGAPLGVEAVAEFVGSMSTQGQEGAVEIASLPVPPPPPIDIPVPPVVTCSPRWITVRAKTTISVAQNIARTLEGRAVDRLREGRTYEVLLIHVGAFEHHVERL